MTILGNWIACYRPNHNARMRLICFPYAGGGASLFRTWPESLPNFVDIWPIQMPGRENRLMEPVFTNVTSLVHTLGHILSPHLSIPYAIFGHSLGALIAFELTRHLRALNIALPVHVFVSAHRAPHIPYPIKPIYGLPQREFIEALRQRYQGIPQEVLANEELMELLVPGLRADFTMVETYSYSEQKPLACPITALGGTEDPIVCQEHLMPWREHTTAEFDLQMFADAHFFVNRLKLQVLEAISAKLSLHHL